MKTVFEFPLKAAYGKPLPKTKIYAYAIPTTMVKNFFVQQVDKITWAYKLSPKTINLPASDHVQEIQVMVIDLKGESLSHDVLAAIDKAIPSPILFELRFKNKTRYAMAFKRPSEADKNKRVISVYFESDWINPAKGTVPLPVSVNLKGLYQNFLKALIPISTAGDEPIDQIVERAERLQMLQREAERIEARIKKEKQYNRKVELHGQFMKIKNDMHLLTL